MRPGNLLTALVMLDLELMKFAKGCERAAQVTRRMRGAFEDVLVELDARLSVPGRWMFAIALKRGMLPLDAYAWLEQFPGAFRSAPLYDV